MLINVHVMEYNANSILYFTLNYSLKITEAMEDVSAVADYTMLMTGVTKGDNDSGFPVNPQDGNTWSIKSGLADSDKVQVISASFVARWGTYGALAPEVYKIDDGALNVKMKTYCCGPA